MEEMKGCCEGCNMMSVKQSTDLLELLIDCPHTKGSARYKCVQWRKREDQSGNAED